MDNSQDEGSCYLESKLTSEKEEKLVGEGGGGGGGGKGVHIFQRVPLSHNDASGTLCWILQHDDMQV